MGTSLTAAIVSVLAVWLVLSTWLIYRFRQGTVTAGTWAIVIALGIGSLDPIVWYAGQPGRWLDSVNGLPSLIFYITIIMWPSVLRVFQLYIDGVEQSWRALRKQVLFLGIVLAVLSSLTIISIATGQQLDLLAAVKTPLTQTPLTHIFGLVARGYVALVLADVSRWAISRQRQADASSRVGLLLLGVGTGTQAFMTALLAFSSAAGLFNLTIILPLSMGVALNMISGVFIVLGICLPVMIARVRAAYSWFRHYRIYRRLTPLGKVVAKLYPEHGLSHPGVNRRSLQGIRFLVHRRQAEIHDALVRLKPYIDGHSSCDSDEAARLVQAVRDSDLASTPSQRSPHDTSHVTEALQSDTRRLLNISANLRKSQRNQVTT